MKKSVYYALNLLSILPSILCHTLLEDGVWSHYLGCNHIVGVPLYPLVMNERHNNFIGKNNPTLSFIHSVLIIMESNM